MALPIQVAYIPYRVPYALGLRLQQHLVRRRLTARAQLRENIGSSPAHRVAIADQLQDARRIAETDYLLLLEHTPVYTKGKRKDEAADKVASAPLRSADFFETPRGGLLTYHGPGQLVGYPLFDIGAMNLSVRCYVSKLQDSLRSTLSELGISTVGSPSEEARYTGVWVDAQSKIGSLGVHVQHRIVSHGFALNVRDEALEGFSRIVACGLPDVQMTCVNEQLRKLGIHRRDTVKKVAQVTGHHIGVVFAREVMPVSHDLLSWSANAHSVLSHVGGTAGF